MFLKRSGKVVCTSSGGKSTTSNTNNKKRETAVSPRVVTMDKVVLKKLIYFVEQEKSITFAIVFLL